MHRSNSQPVPVVRLTFSTSVRLLTKARAWAYAASQPSTPPWPQGDGNSERGGAPAGASAFVKPTVPRMARAATKAVERDMLTKFCAVNWRLSFVVTRSSQENKCRCRNHVYIFKNAPFYNVSLWPSQQAPTLFSAISISSSAQSATRKSRIDFFFRIFH